MDRTIILGTVPVGGLPPDDAGADVLIELSDDAPEDGSSGDCRVFAVEGTIVGDGRPWKRVSWSRAPDSQLPPAAPRAQALVVRTALARWS
jgi:hypothetical protein